MQMTKRETGAAPEGQVRNLRLACGAVLVALGVAVWADWPYLVVENRRLDPWKIAGLWIGDVTALLWFARFAFVHAVMGRPLAPVSLSDGRARVRIVVYTIVATMLVDLVFTLDWMLDERTGYAHGVVTQAQVVAIQEHKRPAATWYDLDCSFADETGASHAAHLRVQAKQHELPARLPPETARALLARGDGANLIRIRYDKRFPARAWVDGLGWEDEQGLYWFSMLTLFFQAITAALFLLLLRPDQAGGILPWWWDVYKALPLAVETFWLLLLGLIDRLMDSLS